MKFNVPVHVRMLFILLFSIYGGHGMQGDDACCGQGSRGAHSLREQNATKAERACGNWERLVRASQQADMLNIKVQFLNGGELSAKLPLGSTVSHLKQVLASLQGHNADDQDLLVAHRTAALEDTELVQAVVDEIRERGGEEVIIMSLRNLPPPSRELIEAKLNQFGDNFASIYFGDDMFCSWFSNFPNTIRVDDRLKSYSRVGNTNIWVTDMHKTHHQLDDLLFDILVFNTASSTEWRRCPAIIHVHDSWRLGFRTLSQYTIEEFSDTSGYAGVTTMSAAFDVMSTKIKGDGEKFVFHSAKSDTNGSVWDRGETLTIHT